MNRKEEVQEWFLIKQNWKEWLLDLSDENAGKLLKALYTGDMPEGILGTLVKSHLEEFTRVNTFRTEKQKQRSELATKSANARWEQEKVLDQQRKDKYTNVLNSIDNNTDVPKTNADASKTNANASLRNANTEYIVHGTKDITHSLIERDNIDKDKDKGKGIVIKPTSRKTMGDMNEFYNVFN